MADPRRSSATPDGDGAGGPKRWVVVVGILVAAVLLGLMIFLHLSGVIGPDLH